MSLSDSSLAFPTPDDEDESQFYSSAYDTSASFTMNPLSQHPPRTPHQSITSRSVRESMYSGGMNSRRQSLYEPAHEPPSKDQEPSDDGSEPEPAHGTERVVLQAEIWRDLMLASNGRDKAFKLIQYSLKMLLLVNRRVTIIPFAEAIIWRLEKTVAGLSFARKLMLLFNWLTPITTVLRLQSSSSSHSSALAKGLPSPFLHTLLHAPPPVLLELVNAFADDLHAYALLGLLPKRLGERAARMADWCWFFSTIVALVENAVERSVVTEVEGRVYEDEMEGVQISKAGGPASGTSKRKVDHKEVKRLQLKSYWLEITRAKLVLDLIFVSFDLWRITRGKDVIKTVAGLGSAILSSLKLVEKQRTILAKTV